MMTEHSLRVLLVDDDEIVRDVVSRHLRRFGQRVEQASDGATGLEMILAKNYDVALVDIRMAGMDGLALLAEIREACPGLPVVIMTGHGDVETAIEAMRLGATDFLRKPIEPADLQGMLQRVLRVRELQESRLRLRATIRGIQSSHGLAQRNRRFLGTSPATHKVREQIRMAVDADCETILITGETGTGKEVVAREIHFTAASEESPFIAVSCPALPDTLVESELFGHMKGAFTGATVDKPGYFELADGGSLFLDEVGDLSAAAQAKLLRVLETRTVRRIGGSEEISVGVRVLAATNAPLEELIRTRRFRRDLFHRLNVFTIYLPPIREHREDIMPLAEHFLSTYANARGLRIRSFSADAKRLLLNYDFPGNARELRNLVERAAVLCRGRQIQAEHLFLPTPAAEQVSASSPSPSSESERERILAALQECRWNRRKAAEKLGMPYSTLRYKIKGLGIS